jgi:hypothetical protein
MVWYERIMQGSFEEPDFGSSLKAEHWKGSTAHFPRVTNSRWLCQDSGSKR